MRHEHRFLKEIDDFIKETLLQTSSDKENVENTRCFFYFFSFVSFCSFTSTKKNEKNKKPHSGARLAPVVGFLLKSLISLRNALSARL